MAEFNIVKQLQSVKDNKYRDFMSKLVPNIDKSHVMGVRAAEIKNLAKSLKNSPNDAEKFMHTLPHFWLEENLLHAVLITQIKDYKQCLDEMKLFLPYADNWAITDTMISRTRLRNTFAGHYDDLHCKIVEWLKSRHAYTIRFAIGLLMNFFLENEHFQKQDFAMVAKVKHQDYYVKMMVAWYFATALSQRYDETLDFLQQEKTDDWTFNKIIQKAIESYRLNEGQKNKLKLIRKKLR